MYKVRDKVYADAGRILIGKNKLGYSFLGELNEFSEETISIDDMRVEGNFLIYSNGRIVERYNPNMTYEQLKAKYVKYLFDNDAQIAIMLNNGKSESDSALFDKMQEWRDWCGVLAKKVSSLNVQS